MQLFSPILNQMIFLFAFLAIGYLLSKCKWIPEDSATVLSKLESMIFVPALSISTFIKYCTLDAILSVWKVFVAGVVLMAVVLPLSVCVAKLCFKDDFRRRLAAYGVCFSNFVYMGNAIMISIFPDIFFEYTIFTLPFLFLIYLWGVPVLLIGDGNGEGKKPLAERLKAFVNPMLIGMLIGVALGLTQLPLPKAVVNVIDTAGNCMSPLAMMLTGMTVAKINVLELFKKWRIYMLSAFKLLAYPLAYILIFAFIPQSSFVTENVLICGMNFMVMPMGLNAIIIPAAYGKDTTDAAGMALISHALSIITIPLMFMLFQTVVL